MNDNDTDLQINLWDQEGYQSIDSQYNKGPIAENQREHKGKLVDVQMNRFSEI